MNLNLLSAGALVAIAIALLIQAGNTWDLPAQERHFKVITKYCQELPSVRAQGGEGYLRCVREFAIQ